MNNHSKKSLHWLHTAGNIRRLHALKIFHNVTLMTAIITLSQYPC